MVHSIAMGVSPLRFRGIAVEISDDEGVSSQKEQKQKLRNSEWKVPKKVARHVPRAVTVADVMPSNRYNVLAVDNEECTTDTPVKETIGATHVQKRNRSACGRSEPRSAAYIGATPGLRTTSPVVQRPSGLL